MIFGNIKANENVSSYQKAIQKAIQYLKENDLVNAVPGRYELDGDNMILQVLDVETTERCNLRPEVHETYIDVQFLAKGKELIGCYPDMGDNEVDENLLETRDLIFYKNNENARETHL
ncbi:YhcH/YjgK/YiaL family protein, partial [Klebsiella pneumoniae]|nr:YhcH/YjgK/YiaL family protein [Klebsiella pneumoniae]